MYECVCGDIYSAVIATKIADVYKRPVTRRLEIGASERGSDTETFAQCSAKATQWTGGDICGEGFLRTARLCFVAYARAIVVVSSLSDLFFVCLPLLYPIYIYIYIYMLFCIFVATI